MEKGTRIYSDFFLMKKANEQELRKEKREQASK